MSILLTQEQREVLLNSYGNADSLKCVLDELRVANPDAFHTAATLAQRIFFDQPLHGEPHYGFVRAKSQKNAA